LCQKYGQKAILDGIKKDLTDFGCEHRRFFSESSLVENGAVAETLEKLKKEGRSYEKDGALWFGARELGDEKDRVLRKSDGYLTYFATDIAYHDDKFARGNQWLIDVWGADHHGYIPRMKAAVKAIGEDPAKLDVVLVQLVALLKNGEPVPMSTRAGKFVTLAEVVGEVGADAARFMFLSRSSDSPLDFDLELAKKRTLDNPVYYAQYAHARVRALERRAADMGIEIPPRSDPAVLRRLDKPEELEIMKQIAAFEETVENAARALAPHHISRYVLELAAKIHSYYGKYTVIDPEDKELTVARVALLRAGARAVRNGLYLLGVGAPDIM
ncbi:MAG: arginine--tRNA ligase, partial [Desulfovibrio sp.]|nr:arginine--tRNA ligase [Desulfovibrio sp.]